MKTLQINTRVRVPKGFRVVNPTRAAMYSAVAMPAASSDRQMSSPPERKNEAATAAIPPIIHTVPIDHLLMLINTSRETTEIEQRDQPTRAPEHRKHTFPTLRGSSGEPSEQRQVHPVLPEILPLRGFENLRDFQEPVILHDISKSLPADLAFPDMFMPIDMRPQRRLGIVHMNCRKLLQSDGLVECAEHILVSFAVAEIVSRRKDMACVDADADSIRIFHAVDDRGDLLKAVPQHRPLARGCFDNREDPRSVRPVLGVVP